LTYIIEVRHNNMADTVLPGSLCEQNIDCEICSHWLNMIKFYLDRPDQSAGFPFVPHFPNPELNGNVTF